MAANYKLYGIESSPYSVKLRAYLRYKGVPHEWVVRRLTRMPEFKRYAKLPLIPLLVTPEGEGLQDSTPIIERLEESSPEPSIHPVEPVAWFVSALIEEYADEWVNKPMFHYRWTYEPDQEAAALAIARESAPEGAPQGLVQGIADQVKKRMIPRLALVGSSDDSAALIEASYERQLVILEAHLAARPYLFGARPAFADFAYFGQLYELRMDPTPGALMRAEAPHVCAWVERMLSPRAEGPFEPWRALEPSLSPLLTQEVAGCFLPWTKANADALAAGEDRLRVELEDGPLEQKPQKYHAKSYAALLEKRRAVRDDALDQLLERTGCASYL